MVLEELGKRILFFDGAMGTQLLAAGLAQGERPEMWNLTHEEAVRDIHLRYLRAGADLVTSNTFGINALRFAQDQVEQLTARAVRIARDACRLTGRGAVALDMGPTGRMLEPYGDLGFERAVELYAQVARAGESAGADCVLIETMADAYELKAAVLGAKEGCGLPILATVTVDEAGRLLTGADLPTVAALLEGLGVRALGLNCGLGPRQMEGLLAQLRQVCSLPIIVQPNAGLPRQEGERVVYDVDAEGFARSLERICEGGAWIVGGCCGTTPEHIQRAVAACRAVAPRPLPERRRTVITSGRRAVALGERTCVVGERINPTGKPALEQALRAHDMDELLDEADAQAESGADVLDVNVGLSQVDEAALLGEAVQAIQAVTSLPLQIDTASPAAMERAMRLYNGKPMVNSVTCRQEDMDAIFPLVKKYGGVVIGLTMDEEGIPKTAEGRVRIAEKILRRAEEYGIGREDVVMDALTLAISAGADARVTLEAARRIKEELGVRTILGISNVSFGLPGREQLNAAFLSMAVACGLDAAIVNPLSEPVMRALCAAQALVGADPDCASYIAKTAGKGAR